jgi:hypothetical protein
MALVDITEDNISELMKSKDSKSTQRAVTRSIKLFLDFFIQKNGLLSSGDNGNDEEIRIGKPRPERMLIFPERQTSGSAGVNCRH